MDHSLVSSYKETTYSVPELDINIRFDEENKKLHQFLENSSKSSWVFITAWNPKSKLLSEKENYKRNRSLKKDLRHWKFYNGIGIPDENEWSPEKSFFVLGISKSEADRLAKKYGQNAYVYGTKEIEVQLITAEY